MLVRNEESCAEVCDVGFDFRETPDVTVVDKIVALPEGEVIRLGEEALHLDVDSGAGVSWLLDAVEADLSSDAAFDAVCCDDHFGSDFFCRFAGTVAELDADEACSVFDVPDKFSAGFRDDFGAVVFGEAGEVRVELFAVEHDARAFLREVDVNAVRTIDVESVDNRFDAAVVNRAVGLQVRKLGAGFSATYGVANFFSLLEKEYFVACTGEIPCGNASAGAGANDDYVVFFVTEHRSSPGA